MKRFLYSTFLFCLVPLSLISQKNGGMWIPTELNEKEMKELGLEISVSEIFNTTKPSIKDAIVQFGGGCTGEIISPQGLVLTNHHCGYSNIQAHSSVENDLLSKGFWAKNNSEELPNTDLSVTIVTDIQNVTDKVFEGSKGLSESEAQKIIEKNIEKIKTEKTLKPFQQIVIKPMYAGNQYYAFLSETYKDVRLVGAPPQSIGKYGADTDNWVYPRHTGDVSLFRIYANKNNEPAEYSADNVPYKPKYFLPISIRDIKEGDFTFIFGYPGRTSEYLPAIAIEQTIKYTNPLRIGIRDIALNTLDEKMRQDNATRIKYSAKYAGISNAWKKWKGESKGLKRSKAVEKRREYEKNLMTKNPQIKNVLDSLNAIYAEQVPYLINNAIFSELLRNSETFYIAYLLNNMVELYEKNNLTDSDIAETKAELIQIYKDFDEDLDIKVLAKIISYYVNNIPKNWIDTHLSKYKDVNQNLKYFEQWNKKSVITNEENINKLFADRNKLVQNLKKDKFIGLYNNILTLYRDNCAKEFTDKQNKINSLQKRYMALLMQTDKERVFFPDANFTLRVSYGKVKGSNPADAVKYDYQTTLDGVIEKYIPNDYEFDLPEKLLDLYNKKDYGQYTNAKGQVPVAFTATNHTTGGNSGSPALDSKGNLIGINFDRQWEGTMSDIYFDPQLCRNIMVDTRYLLFLIDKFANAKWLLDELKIVK